jgi:hypothetical protein
MEPIGGSHGRWAASAGVNRENQADPGRSDETASRETDGRPRFLRQKTDGCPRFLRLAALVALFVGMLAGFGPADARGQVSGGKLPTQWDKDVSPTNPLSEYPRPQMVRARWQSLNGPWDYAPTDASVTSPPTAFDAGKILVPYPYESSLSGIGKPSPTDRRLWYRRTFTVPDAWRTSGQRVLLHLGAVNWDSTVAVNGKEIGKHKGGFDGFDVDITDTLQPGDNTLIVSAWNPMVIKSPDAQVVGKQREHPSHIFYTGSTGIWQSVWLEPVPASHITSLKIVPDIDARLLHVTVTTDGAGTDSVDVSASDEGKPLASTAGKPGTEISLPIADPHLWSPEDPHLYDLHVTLKQGDTNGDAVDGYFAMRKISLGKDDQGRARIFLNNKFVFEVGALDQGYWPDGIYTAPTDDALKSDILAAKSFGLNLLRKHAKVEPDRWYFWADKLGMLVWQDMPQCFDSRRSRGECTLSEAAKAQWLVEWQRILAGRVNHPCIIVWTTFNEGWGQHDTESIVALTKQIDPSRLANDASGWVDKGVGDLSDTHAYPGPWCEPAGDKRASVNGEFGGLAMRVSGHMWTNAPFDDGATARIGWKVTQKYQKLLETAYALRETRGCSAFVYTQLTDVENESNGLLTYDRAVVKSLVDIIAAANRGQFLPLPPAPVSNDPVPTSEEDGQTWAYVTQKPADDWAQPAFDGSKWKTGPAPFGQGYAVNTRWADTPGDIWLRRTVSLPQTIPAKLVVRTIHDEGVEVYVNGVLAARAPGHVGDYVELPMSDAARAALKPGENVIAVHCHQTTGGQVIDVGIVGAQ